MARSRIGTVRCGVPFSPRWDAPDLGICGPSALLFCLVGPKAFDLSRLAATDAAGWKCGYSASRFVGIGAGIGANAAQRVDFAAKATYYRKRYWVPITRSINGLLLRLSRFDLHVRILFVITSSCHTILVHVWRERVQRQWLRAADFWLVTSRPSLPATDNDAHSYRAMHERYLPSALSVSLLSLSLEETQDVGDLRFWYFCRYRVFADSRVFILLCASVAARKTSIR